MAITKIRKYKDLKNLTEIAKLFYAEELASYIPQNRAFSSVRVIADYEHNAVFLKTAPGFSNQKLLEERPDLFTKAFPAKGTLIEDITLRVLDLYRDNSDDITRSILAMLEAAIFYATRSGQVGYLRRHGGAFIKSDDEITDLESVANVIFNKYVHDGKLMLKEMQTTFSHEFHILLETIYGKLFTSDYAYDDEYVCDLTERFTACALLENKSDCTREDIKRYILTAARAAMGWYLE